MRVLHGAWIGAVEAEAARFALWGEEGGTPSRRRRGATSVDARARRHPFALSAEALWEALGESWQGRLEEASLLARLPTHAGTPLPPPELAAESGPAEVEGADWAIWRVSALVGDARRATELLASLRDEPDRPERVLGADLRFWSVAARLVLELLTRQRLLPSIERQGNRYQARWRLTRQAEDRTRIAALAAAMPPACAALSRDRTALQALPAPREVLDSFLDAAADGLARQAAAAAELGTSKLPARRWGPPKRLKPHDVWIEALRGNPALSSDSRQWAAFQAQYQTWIATAPSAAAEADSFRLCFRLNPPPDEPDPVLIPPRRDSPRDWSLQFLLQANDDPSLLVPAADVWRQRGASAQFLNRRFEQPQERLLAGLGRAARLFPPLEAGLLTARPESCAVSVSEAYDFLRDKALVLQASGFGVMVPGLDARLGVRVRLGRPRSSSSAGQSQGIAAFGQHTLVEYDWQVALGGETLTREEFEALAKLKEPLVQVRGRWVELRPEQVERALAFFQTQSGGQMALHQALELALSPQSELGLPIEAVESEGWIGELLNELRGGGKRDELGEPSGFHGQLRPYQRVGLSWLAALRRYALGACLADDMGLGKTIQVIALLLHNRSREKLAPALLVCPTSVVGNWRRELTRFAPSLRVLVHHGPDRNKETFAQEAARHDLVISTYALLHRDEAELGAVQWDELILDEAQNVKNASTQTARMARTLPARWRAALTGTPVENRLSDLWSLFQFLNPGYLGSAEQFRTRFTNPIERVQDQAATARLKSLVAPFILRRLKTDRSIIDDLPEKHEMKVYCTLTREQATLYQAIVQDSLREIEEADGAHRRGHILATLTRLKQVCDHPALFLHDGSVSSGRSGKLARLGEMLEEVVSVGDRALVFTQYAEMGKLLKQHLETTLGQETLLLHGGTPMAERDRLVTRFQAEGRGPAVFVLSIKAGGTGLNLTRANHVFHFDRWWNPAVERQATDRAFRIGQRRDVQVHTFICAGTLEEALDELIERKMALSEAIVGAGESWITEMSDAQLRELFALRQDAVAED